MVENVFCLHCSLSLEIESIECLIRVLELLVDQVHQQEFEQGPLGAVLLLDEFVSWPEGLLKIDGHAVLLVFCHVLVVLVLGRLLQNERLIVLRLRAICLGL